MIDKIREQFKESTVNKKVKHYPEHSQDIIFKTTVTFVTRYLLGWNVWEVLKDREYWEEEEAKKIIKELFEVTDRELNCKVIRKFIKLAYIYHDLIMLERPNMYYTDYLLNIVKRNIYYLKHTSNQWREFDIQGWLDPDYEIQYAMFSDDYSLVLVCGDSDASTFLKLFMAWRMNQSRYRKNQEEKRYTDRNHYMFQPQSEYFDPDTEYIKRPPYDLSRLIIFDYTIDKVYVAYDLEIDEEVIEWADEQF